MLARDLPLETTSAVAAAIWYPYRAWPQERVLAWSRTTYEAFARIAAEHPDSGVVLRDGTEAVARRDDVPWWAEAVPDLRETVEVPDPHEMSAEAMATPERPVRVLLALDPTGNSDRRHHTQSLFKKGGSVLLGRKKSRKEVKGKGEAVAATDGTADVEPAVVDDGPVEEGTTMSA